jgi:hypothetical protein
MRTDERIYERTSGRTATRDNPQFKPPDELIENVELEDGDNVLLENGGFIVLE